MSGPDATVRWQRLELHGFGRHLSLEVSFSDGLTTLVAPNEFGKSTLVSGLVATLFGLPHVSDPTKFGRERYRNWANPSRFEGEVDFTGRDGGAYTLHRNFETHEVRIVRHAGSGAEEVYEGTHNPIARTGVEGYEAQLDALVGMTDREAFRQSFHVAQPLPAPEQLGDEVQRLLSGSGQGTFDAALGTLEDAVKKRTSATGDLGVTARNQRNPRELEQLDEGIDDLQSALREGRDAADKAKEVGTKLAELEAERTRLQAEAERLEKRAEAHRSWLARKDAYASAAGSHRELQEALKQAKNVSEQIEVASREILQTWPEFAHAGADVETALVAAHEADEELREAEEALQHAEDHLETRREAARQAGEASAAHHEGAPAGPGAWRAEDLQELQQDAQQAVRDWDRYRSREDEIARRERDLERFGSLADADPETLALLRNYTFEQERRAQALAHDGRTPHEAPGTPQDGGNPMLRLAVAALVALVAGGVVSALTNVVWGLVAGTVAGLAGYAVGPGRTRTTDAGRAPHPTGTPGPGPAREAGAAQRELDAFVEATRPYVESLEGVGTPDEAVRTWDDERRALAEVRRLQKEHTERIWNVSREQIGSVVPSSLAGAWGNLAKYAHSRGAAADSLEGLVGWLRDRDEAVWSEEIGRAEEAARERAAWEQQRQELTRRAEHANTLLQAAEEQRDRARAAKEAARSDAEAARSSIEELLTATGAAPTELLERWRAYGKAVAERDALKGSLAGMLKGRGVDTLEELAQREYEAGVTVVEIRRGVEELRETNPELPPLTAERREVAEALRELEQATQEADAAVKAANENAFELGMQKSTLAGKDLINIAQAELDLADMMAERDRVAAEIDAHVLAYRELTAAIQAFQATHRERLEQAATAYLRSFSAAEGRRVALGEGFEVGIVEPGGTRAHPGQLSQGTQDQLLLALRLAIADHLADDAPLPLLLDDPFLNWDADRLAQVRTALADLADDRQVVLLSHREDFAAWGEPAEVR